MFNYRHLAGNTWKVKSSRNNSQYSINANEYSFTCTCPGFQFHRNCKHIKQVVTRLEDENYPRYRV